MYNGDEKFSEKQSTRINDFLQWIDQMNSREGVRIEMVIFYRDHEFNFYASFNHFENKKGEKLAIIKHIQIDREGKFIDIGDFYQRTPQSVRALYDKFDRFKILSEDELKNYYPMKNSNPILDILKEKTEKLLTQQFKKNIIFVEGNNEGNKLLNDIENYPHAFVLGCIMDYQISAERAWSIPSVIKEVLGGFDINLLLELTIEQYQEIFEKYKLHRFNNIAASRFFKAVQKIHKDYESDASKIWENSPSSGSVVRRFLEFDGAGIKIATMTTNILVRDFKIQLADKNCIDISPDVQVMKVFKRIGLISDDSKIEQLLYCARELNPDYPGIYDLTAWEIGRDWCTKEPKCAKCSLNGLCKYSLKNKKRPLE